MSKQERIVCAAIKYRHYNSIVESCIDIVLNGVRYIDLIDTGHQYNDLVVTLLTAGKLEEVARGFTTSTGRFVDAKEAQKIAIESGQFIHLVDRIKSLEKGIEWLKAIESDPKSNKENVIAAIDKAKQEIADLQNGYQGDDLRPEDLY